MVAFAGVARFAAVVATCAVMLLQVGAVEDPLACTRAGEEQATGEESCLLQTPLQPGGDGGSRIRDRGAWWKKEKDEALKILFVGNSFTYGPAAYNTTEQNNLPRFFKLVAESLGHKVHQQEDTIGGCSVFMHRPSINPQGLNCSVAGSDCEAAHNRHIDLKDGCTVNEGIGFWDDEAPCPQRSTKQDFGAWDVVALQDHSALPSVMEAVKHMLAPSVSEFSRVLHQSGTHQEHRFGEPVIAMYMTWSYYDGMNHECPGNGGNPACYPNRTLNGFTDCETSKSWYDTVATHPCQAYALARGYADMLEYGAKVLVPCGLAWEAARGSEPIPQDCKAAIDAEFPDPGPLADLNLPLKLKQRTPAPFQGTKAHELYRYLGPTYNSSYCDDGCHHDHHPSGLGQYLNALVFFATLFKKSPLGADWPRGQVVDGMVMPTIDEEDAKVLQRIAHDTVLPHLDTWWSGSSTPKRAAPPPMPMSKFNNQPSRELLRGSLGNTLGGFQSEKPAGSYDI